MTNTKLAIYSASLQSTTALDARQRSERLIIANIYAAYLFYQIRHSARRQTNEPLASHLARMGIVPIKRDGTGS